MYCHVLQYAQKSVTGGRQYCVGHMAEHGQVDVIRADAGESLYRRCGAGEHHHHLRCRSCGQVTELAAPAVEAWASEVARSSGYIELSHSLEITGICPACADG